MTRRRNPAKIEQAIPHVTENAKTLYPESNDDEIAIIVQKWREECLESLATQKHYQQERDDEEKTKWFIGVALTLVAIVLVIVCISYVVKSCFHVFGRN
jgi:Flp pilus assembly protein TadB